MQKPKSGTYYLGAIVYPYRKIYPWKLVSNSGRDWQWFYFAPLNPWTSLFCSRFFSMKVLVIWLLSTAHMSITCRKPSFTWSEGQKPLWLSSSNYHKLLLLPWWVNYSPLRWGPQPLLLPYNFHSILFLHFFFHVKKPDVTSSLCGYSQSWQADVWGIWWEGLWELPSVSMGAQQPCIILLM